MTEGENRRVVKKSNNTNKMNIKVSTQDKTLSKDNDIKLNIDGQKNKNGKKNASEIKTTLDKEAKEETIDVRISKLIEKNKQSQKEIETIKTNINTKSKNEVDQILTLNSKLSTLEKDHYNISNKNKTLLTKLKNVEEEVSKRFEDKFKISKVIQKQKQIDANKIDVNAEIKLKEKQKKNVKKSIKYQKKELKIMKNILEKNKEENEQKLGDELNEINENIKKIKKEIEELKKIETDHRLCKNNQNILKTKLNVLSNEYEFEYKKSNMIETEKKAPTVINNVNMTMKYGQSIRTRLLKNTKNKYSSKVKVGNYKSYNFLIKDMKDNTKEKGSNINLQSKSLNDLTLQTSVIVNASAYYSFLKNDVNSKIDTKSPKKYLFNEQEKDILKKILPTEYYNSCNEKYNKIDNQLTEIGDRFKEHDQIKNDINLNNIKFDEINLRIKELSLIKTKLYVNYTNNNKKITELKKKINSYKEAVKKENLLIKVKNKNNDLLKNKIDTLKKVKKLQTEA